MTISRRQLWLLLAVETTALLVLVVWILSQLGRLTEPSALLVGVAIVAAGDVATAVLMQRFAPTEIVLEPGEQAPRVAWAVEDFDDAGRGLVSLRGERWKARAGRCDRVRKGAAVRILGREGLTLVVEPSSD